MIKVFDLELFDTCYYIKRNTIVEKIVFNNRTFYAKFERIEEPLTPLLIQQHLQQEYTIAVPLLKHNHTTYLVIEYKGEEYQRFIPLIQHLFKRLMVTHYQIYQGKEPEKIQVFIKVEHYTLSEAHTKLSEISDALKQKLTKRWKCLPSPNLPEAYNIVTLPYRQIL